MFPRPDDAASAGRNGYNVQISPAKSTKRVTIYSCGPATCLAAARPIEARPWDEAWRWSEGGTEQPRVALYSYLLSTGNPSMAAFDRSYRQLEGALRPYNCTACHNPANPHHVVPLVFFTHPAQALTSRHQIARMLKLNRMPPEGIADDRARGRLIALADRFAQTGDAALAYERSRLGAASPGRGRKH